MASVCPLISPGASLLLSLSYGSSFPKHFPKCHLFCSPLTTPRNKCAHPQHKDEDTVSEVRPLAQGHTDQSSQTRIPTPAPEADANPVSQEGKRRHNRRRVPAPMLLASP